jgi:hypothetical protein
VDAAETYLDADKPLTTAFRRVRAERDHNHRGGQRHVTAGYFRRPTGTGDCLAQRISLGDVAVDPPRAVL